MKYFPFESFFVIFSGVILSLFSIRLSRQQNYVDLFAPPMIVLLTMWTQYYLPALTLPYYDYWIYPHRWEKERVIFYPILISSVGWIAFLVGYKSKLAKDFAKKIPVPYTSKYTSLISFSLMVIGIISISVAISQSGGLIEVAKRGKLLEGTGKWFILGLMTHYGIIFSWTYPKLRVVTIFISITYFIYITAAQGRGAALSPFVFLFIMSYYLFNLSNKTTVILASLFVFIIIIIVSLGRLLTITTNLYNTLWSIIFSLPNQIIITINRDLSRLEQLSVILEIVPSEIDYFWGAGMVKSLLGPFSKYLIPDHIDWRIILTSVALYNYPTALSWGFGGTGIGEWYANFGFLGVIIGWLIFGIMGRSLYLWFQNNRQEHYEGPILPMYISMLSIFMGCIGETIGYLFSIFYLLPIITILHWYRPIVKNSTR